jgi:hypothetical protein
MSFKQRSLSQGLPQRTAKPADLPIEQSRKFKLAVNLKTAKGAPHGSSSDHVARRRDGRIRVGDFRLWHQA